MPWRQSAVVALTASIWELVTAWWMVDRIRVPRSRSADRSDTLADEVRRSVDSQEREEQSRQSTI